MRIGFDGYNYSDKYVGGASTYLKGLLNGFVETLGKNTLQIYASESNQHLFSNFLKNEQVSVIVIPNRATSFYKSQKLSLFIERVRKLAFTKKNLWLYELCQNLLCDEAKRTIEANSDLMYFPLVTMWIYSLKIPTYLSVHDIQQVHYPEFFGDDDLHYRFITYNLSAKNATYIQASTFFMKEDFLKYFKFLKPNQIFKISEGVDLSSFVLKDKNPTELLSSFDLPESFIFLPAQLWHHKNHITLLKALMVLKTRYNLIINLVLTGAKYSSADLVFDFINKNDMSNVKYLGVVSREQIVALYSKAKLLVITTLYESSSLPLLEAAAMGVPILATEIPPLQEMCPPFEINYFSPLDENNLAKQIKKLLSDEDLLKSQTLKNNQLVANYSWTQIAQQYINFFQQTNKKEFI